MSAWAFYANHVLNRWFGTRRLDYDGEDLQLHVSNVREYDVRAKSCRKEPETVAWIETFAKPNGVLYDIGANVGAYSLVAAANGLAVWAFEPAFWNYHQLCRNITLNGLDNRIAAMPVAFGRESRIASFKFVDATAGSSKGFYNDRNVTRLDSKRIRLEKRVMVFSLDDFVRNFHLPQPAMMKIDVDGGELDVLLGADRVLSSPILTTLMVEVDTALSPIEEIEKLLSRRGLELEERFRRTREDVFNCRFVRRGSEPSS